MMRAIAGSDPIAVGEIGVSIKASNASPSRAVEPADEAPTTHRRR
jgi:hypothetical protein